MSSEENSIYIPIPHYPPFKLRSSLIDKDPVIWVHLLEAYIELFKYLTSDEYQTTKLTVKSQQQLQIFLKEFLVETAEEATKIFSLGAINPDIKNNTSLLRTYVFQLVKTHSIVKLNLTGESVWNFIVVYVRHNASVVRGLVDGTFKSKYNDNKKSGNISSISVVHKYLEQMISNGKFKDNELNSLSYLLGQYTTSATKTKTFTVSGGGNNKVKNINKKPNSNFAENFVSIPWIEMLEKLYNNGKSVHAKILEKIMIICIIALPVSKIAKLVTGLGINTVNALILSPLLSTILISDGYKELNPGLEERLPFLRNLSFVEDDDESEEPINHEHISMLVDLFPQLTEKQAITVLKDNDNNVEHVTNLLLEHPESIASIKEYDPEALIRERAEIEKAKQLKLSNEMKKAQNRFKEDKVTLFSSQKNAQVNSEDLKKKSLSAALQLMYEDDEDEPDDNYEDQEKTTGTALDDSNKKSGSRFKVEDIDAVDRAPEPKVAKPRPESPMEATERYLFGLYKTKGAEIFAKTSRKSSQRLQIRKATDWSDEQIEGWMRMLLKSRKRYKLLEEQFLFGGNPNRGPPMNLNKQSPSPMVESKTPEPLSAKSEKGQSKDSTKSDKGQSKDADKKTFARNEKHKASKANHNRKSKHDKKAVAEMAGMR